MAGKNNIGILAVAWRVVGNAYTSSSYSFGGETAITTSTQSWGRERSIQLAHTSQWRQRRAQVNQSAPAAFNKQQGVIWKNSVWIIWNASLTPPLFQALVREFWPSLSAASSRTFLFTAMSSSPGTMPPAGGRDAPSAGLQPEASLHCMRWQEASRTPRAVMGTVLTIISFPRCCFFVLFFHNNTVKLSVVGAVHLLDWQFLTDF